MFLTLFLVTLLLCLIIFYFYREYRPATLSRFEHFRQLYKKCLSGSFKHLDKGTKVVTSVDEVISFGKLFNRPHPPVRPILKTVFHENNYDDWKSSRKMLVRDILAPKIVKSIEPIMSLCASNVLEMKCHAGVVEVVWLARLYINKVIYRCVFGGDGLHEEEEFTYWSTKLRHEESEALKKTDQLVDGVKDTAAERYFKKLIWSPDRSEESFLSKLKASSATPQDVEAHSVSFILGGFTACVSALVFVLYELADNMDLQEALRAIPVPQKLFTLVVKESLRKYPPFAAVIKTDDSKCTRILSVSGIHRDARVYTEPSKFQPDREYPKHMFCAFGVGIRKCPGEQFSYSAVETFLKHIVSNFKISRKPTFGQVRGELEFSKGKYTTNVDSLELLFEDL